MSFRVGDILAWEGLKDNPRLLVALQGDTPFVGIEKGWSKEDFQVIYLDKKADYIVHGPKIQYTKIQPTAKIIHQAKENVKATFKKNEIDNLTFIEISARLREYEQQL